MAEVRMCCRRVSEIDTWTTPRPLLYDLMANVFHKLRSVTFAYEQLFTDIILALLFHKATLLEISTTWNKNESNIERDEVPIEDDHFRTSGRAVQLLLRSCRHVTVLKLEHHEVDMDWVEEDPWACNGLRHLRVRVRGLDTKEKIDRTLTLWEEGKQHTGKIVQENTGHDEETLMEARVAR